MTDTKRAKADHLRECVLSGPGAATAADREAASRGVGEGPVGAYVAKVYRQATEVADQDVEALRAAGFSDDRIFELTVAAATGAGFRRLDVVLSLLDDAS